MWSDDKKEEFVPLKERNERDTTYLNIINELSIHFSPYPIRKADTWFKEKVTAKFSALHKIELNSFGRVQALWRSVDSLVS